MPTATADDRRTRAVTRPAAPRTTSTHAAPLRQRFAAAAHTPVASGSVTAFRIAFGALIVFSTVRFVARGWVEEFYLSPAHHLTYADFAWVQPLSPPLMYALMAALAALGVSIAIGYRTRLAAGVFAVGFAYLELIDAALYLNHYWFVTLAAVTLAVVPAPSGGTVPAVTVWALRAQIAVVYVFAGLAKLNPDWLFDAQPMRLWLSARTDRPVIGPWLDEPSVGYLFSWAGAAFDLTIVGWLLWRRSRPAAYVAVVVFHVATAMLFQIGVFPWVMIALTPIFFAPDWPRTVRRWVTGRRVVATAHAPGGVPNHIGPVVTIALVVLAVVNVVLPLRHYAADGNVRFNDDGYYLSWRVMLTERTGFLEFDVTDPETGETWRTRPDAVLEDWQAAQATQRPDLALTTAHLVAADFAARGHPGVEVRADSWVAVNGRPRQRWVDPAVDLAALARDAAASTYVLPVRDPSDTSQ
ncbi:MAG: HTTM domain-containing protein [Ilumatobacteraceae bacterium]